ncbi:MAG: cupredoxin family protein [Rhodospirillales bacterium]|nr:cupredoxin family protein [Rhodospirillales bacterium]
MIARLSITGIAFAAVLAAALPISGNLVSVGAVAHTAHVFAAGEPGDPKKPYRTIELTMREGNGTMAYEPGQIEVKRGEQIMFVLLNAGALPHEFLLDSFENNAKHKIEMQKNPEMEHDEPNGKRVEPKSDSKILWRFSKAGTFEFGCLIPGHYEAGMKGTVIVK